MPKTEPMHSGRRFWLLVGVWALTIFGLSSIPGRSMPRIEVLRFDKVLHAAVYSVLGGLCCLAARRTWSLDRRAVVVVGALCALLYGMTDELHQLFVPGRCADIYDVMADGIGGLIGAAIAIALPIARAGAG